MGGTSMKIMDKKIFNIFTNIIIVFLLLFIIFSNVNAVNNEYIDKIKFELDFIDISVEEAWTLLTSTENGIQIPIDIRGLEDWYAERIDTPYPEDPKRYSFFVQDGFDIFTELYDGKEVIISCYSGSSSRNVAQMLVDKNFNGTIYNLMGGFNAWKDGGFPTKIFNDPPNSPSIPSGQLVCVIGNSYSYNTIAVDPDDDSIRYGWSWDGDFIVDEWSDYFLSDTLVTINHLWDNPGFYNILVLAEDNVGEQSDFSPVLSIITTTKPNLPIIDGVSNGNTGIKYEYRFFISDPDGDDLFLYIDWGDLNIDDWIGPYNSEEELIFNHTYIDDGTYNIRAKVKDIYDIESDWSEHEVVMPRNKSLQNWLTKYYLKTNYSLLHRIINFFI
jgi:rhodanese-related sulfurtransferase